MFRSAPPGGGDQIAPSGCECWSRFDPRPRVGATGAGVPARLQPGFDPRPRVGATPRRRAAHASGPVSIRAPGWGRPAMAAAKPARTGFDPRPRVGATQSRPIAAESNPSFDPRPRVGATLPGARLCDALLVSIRAPGWGRLLIEPHHVGQPPVSIRAPGWGRPTSLYIAHAASRFDPRPRVGATGTVKPQSQDMACFDPRPRVGATKAFIPGPLEIAVSIRAPGWGRRVNLSLGARSDSFDPRPRVGATASPASDRARSSVSIRAPGWGRP